MTDFTLELDELNRLYIEQETLYNELPSRIRYDDANSANDTLRKFLRILGAMFQLEKDWIEALQDDIDPYTMRSTYLKNMLESFNFSFVDELSDEHNRYVLDNAVDIFRGKGKLEFIADILSGFFDRDITVWEGNQFGWRWNTGNSYAYTADSSVVITVEEGTTEHEHTITLTKDNIADLTYGRVAYLDVTTSAWSVDSHTHSARVIHRAKADELEITLLTNHSQSTYQHDGSFSWEFSSSISQEFDSPEWFDGDMHWSDGAIDVSIYFVYEGDRLDSDVVASTRELVSKLVPFRAHTYIGQRRANFTGTVYFLPHYKYRRGDDSPILYDDPGTIGPDTTGDPIFTLLPGYVPNVDDANDVVDVEGIQTIGNAVVKGSITLYQDIRGPFERMISYASEAAFGMTFDGPFDSSIMCSVWFAFSEGPDSEGTFFIIGQPSNKLLSLSIYEIETDLLGVRATVHLSDGGSKTSIVGSIKRDKLVNLIVTYPGYSSFDIYLQGDLAVSIPVTEDLNEVTGFYSSCPTGAEFLVSTIQFSEAYLTESDALEKYESELSGARPYNVCNLSVSIADDKTLWTRLVTFDYYSDRDDADVVVSVNNTPVSYIVSEEEVEFASGFFAINFVYTVGDFEETTKIRFTIPDRPTVYTEGDTIFGGSKGEFVDPNSEGLLAIPLDGTNVPVMHDAVTITSNTTDITMYLADRTMYVSSITRDSTHSYLRLGTYSGTHTIYQNSLSAIITAYNRERYLLPVLPTYDGGDNSSAEAIRVDDTSAPFWYALSFNETGAVVGQSTWLWDEDGQASEEQKGPVWTDGVYWSQDSEPLIIDYDTVTPDLGLGPWSMLIWINVSEAIYQLTTGAKFDVFGKWGDLNSQHCYRLYIQDGDIVLELACDGRSNTLISIGKSAYSAGEYFKLSFVSNMTTVDAYVNQTLAASVTYDGETNVSESTDLYFGLGANQPFFGRLAMFQMVGYSMTESTVVEAYENENSLRSQS